MADIGSLVVKISADASQLAKELEKISGGGAQAAKGIENAGKIMAASLIAVTTAAVANTLAIAKQVEETDLLAQKTGIAIQTLQSWSVIMAADNFQAQSLTTGMRTLSKEILEVRNPASTAANAFATLGIGMDKLGSTEDAIRAVADVFKTMPDGAEKSALAVQLFGKAGLEMIPILNKGAAALDESKAKAQAYGLILSTDAVNSLKAVDDASDDLGLALQGLRTQFAVAFAPTLKTAIDAITASVVSLKDHVIDLKEAMGDTSAQAFLGRAIVEDAQKTLKYQEQNEQERGEQQEKLGTLIRNNAIREQMFINARRKAEEQLGHDVLQIAERERKERNDAFAEQVIAAEKLQSLNEGLGGGGGKTGSAFAASVEHQHEMIRNLEAIGVATGDWQDQIDQGREQEAAGAKIVAQSLSDYEHRNDELDRMVLLTEAASQEQQALYVAESGLFGAADAARRTQMNLIDAHYAREKARIDQTIIDEENKAAVIQALDQQTDAKRRGVANQFPTYWEKQLNAIEQSSTFSFALLINTWSSALATMIVKGNDFKQAWEATQIAVVQAGINMAVGVAASNLKALISSEATAALAGAAWEGMGLAVGGAFEVVTGAFMLMTETLVGILTTVGEAIMGVLSAIAEALADTIVGIPWAVAILAGVVLIGVALGAWPAVGVFAEGGVVTGPTLGLLGEAGPEAVIPLDRMGDMGFGSGGAIQTTINIDGKRVARATSRYTASAWRAEGAGA